MEEWDYKGNIVDVIKNNMNPYISGEGMPDNELGSNGQCYIDFNSGKIYKKENNLWILKYENMGGDINQNPPLDRLKSGVYLYRANDSNKPISGLNENQTVYILHMSAPGISGVDIAIITNKGIDIGNRWWVTGRWSYNSYPDPVEVTDISFLAILNDEIFKNMFSNLSFTAVNENTNLMVDRDRNLACFYDWVHSNRAFMSGYRQSNMLFFGDTINNTTYANREAIIIGFGSNYSSSWGGGFWVGFRYKPTGTTTWNPELKINL